MPRPVEELDRQGGLSQYRRVVVFALMLRSMPHVSATGSNLGKKLLSLSDKLVNGSNGFRDRLLTAHLSKRTEIQSTMRVLKGWIALSESCNTAPLATELK